MATVSIVNMKGEEIGKREISDAVFGIEPRVDVVRLVVVNHLAKCRQGTQSTLTRSEVRGGGKKPWRQKGTGRARQGSIRSPQWTHGGIALGPKPRKYGFAINRKVRKLAMRSALSDKLKSSSLILVDSIKMDDYKTKMFVEIVNNLKIVTKALFVFGFCEKKVIKSASNIIGIKTTGFNELNVYDILKYDNLVLDINALEKIEEVYA